MRIQLIAAGGRQPAWVNDGYYDYARRLRGSCSLELVEIPLGRRSGSATGDRARREEGERMLRALPSPAHVVALNLTGDAWSTARLTEKLKDWMSLGAPVCLLVGGPDGLADSVLQRAGEHWSISPLTLPHGLVRVNLAEALYRAWSVTQGHPYHRG